MPPPRTPAELLVTAEPVMDTMDPLMNTAPPSVALEPIVIFNALMATAPALVMLNTRLAPEPLKTVLAVSLPVIEREKPMAISPVVNRIGLPLVAGSKTIISPGLALATAARKDPAPLSLELVTVMVALKASPASSARHVVANMSLLKYRRFMVLKVLVSSKKEPGRMPASLGMYGSRIGRGSLLRIFVNNSDSGPSRTLKTNSR